MDRHSRNWRHCTRKLNISFVQWPGFLACVLPVHRYPRLARNRSLTNKRSFRVLSTGCYDFKNLPYSEAYSEIILLRWKYVKEKRFNLSGQILKLASWKVRSAIKCGINAIERIYRVYVYLSIHPCVYHFWMCSTLTRWSVYPPLPTTRREISTRFTVFWIYLNAPRARPYPHFLVSFKERSFIVSLRKIAPVTILQRLYPLEYFLPVVRNLSTQLVYKNFTGHRIFVRPWKKGPSIDEFEQRPSRMFVRLITRVSLRKRSHGIWKFLIFTRRTKIPRFIRVRNEFVPKSRYFVPDCWVKQSGI